MYVLRVPIEQSRENKTIYYDMSFDTIYLQMCKECMLLHITHDLLPAHNVNVLLYHLSNICAISQHSLNKTTEC